MGRLQRRILFANSGGEYKKHRFVGRLQIIEDQQANAARGRSVWQQGLQRPLAGHANAIVNAVLPQGSLLSRMSRLLLAFFISGLLHVLTDVGLGVRSDESGAVLFFCLQPLGIMIEEVAQPYGTSLPTFLRRIIGYAWVIAFMSWSVPVWSYPHLRLGMNAADMVPVHVVAPLIRALTTPK